MALTFKKPVATPILFIGLLLLLSGFPVQALAASATSGMDGVQMLMNLSKTYPAFYQLATAFCYIFGFILCIRGIYYLKVYGELRTMMATQSSLKVPVTYFIVAAVFIYIPSAYKLFLYTTFRTTSPLAYTQINSSINPQVLNAIVGLVQLIGLFAFIRGWLILVAIAQQSGGQHSFGKALTHIVGGIMAMNILGLTDLIWNTFGFNFSL